MINPKSKIQNPKSKIDSNESVVLNDRLAAMLGVRVGDEVLLRVDKPSLLSRDAPLSTVTDASVALRLPVAGIVTDDDFGRFSLEANQVPPLNVFLPIDLLQRKMYQERLVVLTSRRERSLNAYLRKNDLRMVVLRAGCSYRLILESWLAHRGIVGVRILEFGTLEAIISCVEAGLGMTLLPEALVGPVWRDERVAVHPLPNDYGEVDTLFVRRRDGFQSGALRSLMRSLSLLSSASSWKRAEVTTWSSARSSARRTASWRSSRLSPVMRVSPSPATS